MVGSIGAFVRCRCLGLDLLISPSINVKRDPKYKGKLEEIQQNVRNGGVEVGVLTGVGEHPNADGATVAEVAVWNEFGVKSRGIPARPFLRATMRLNKIRYRLIIRKLTKRMLRMEIDSKRAAKILGLAAQSDVQTTLKRISRPKNSERTIALKGSANPLIDTGFLRQSISFAVIRSVRGAR